MAWYVKEEVKVAVGQIAPTWLDTQANLQKMAKVLEEVASGGGCDLMVFPELASQGYVKAPGAPDYQSFSAAYRRVATRVPGLFTDGLGELARKHGCYIISGFTEAHPTLTGNIFNSAVLVSPDGKVMGVHRKVHVPGHEKAYFHGGNTFEVYKTDLGQLGMMVCADFCAPESARTLTMKGAEIICVPYAYPANAYPNNDVFNWANATRAWENGNFMVAADRVGKEDANEFWGRSCVCDPYGRILAMAEEYAEEVITATLRRQDLFESRAKYNRFRDRRPDLYGPITERF